MMIFITAEERRLIQLIREEQARLRDGQAITMVITIDNEYMTLGTVAPKGKVQKQQQQQPLMGPNGHK